MAKELSIKPLFIGLAGTLNAGKDSFGDKLADEYGFLHMSTSDMIREMKRREFGADSPKALLLRNDPFINQLRTERGPGFLIDAVDEEWRTNKDKFPGGYVASAMRAIGEAEAVRAHAGTIVFVDADPEVRYERSQLRQRDANEEGKSFEEFMATERLEIDVDPNDKAVQNLTAMKEMADLVIINNGNDIEAFKEQAIKELQDFLEQN